MEVYIIYCKDGYGGSMVDKVFAKKPDAIGYVIKNIFGSNEHYTSQTRAENEKDALGHIETHEVVG